jgi:tRNA-dihydrouridine synthase B
MLSASALIRKPIHAQRRFVAKDPAEGPVCFQLAASETKDLTEAVKISTDCGADLIDLNCGCPVKKMRSKGACSSLLTNPQKLFQLITVMKQNTHLPVSIKIRVEGGDEKFNAELVKVISEAGADFLTVHGRHWTEHYETPCRHDQIQYFAEEMKIPVIGNGDVSCVDSLKKMLATGCAGVMIARAGVGQPWLIKKLIAQINNEEFTPPSREEVKTLFLQHIQQLGELIGGERFAVIQGRTFAKYYARGMPKRSEFCFAVNKCDNFENLKTICDTYFNS